MMTPIVKIDFTIGTIRVIAINLSLFVQYCYRPVWPIGPFGSPF